MIAVRTGTSSPALDKSMEMLERWRQLCKPVVAQRLTIFDQRPLMLLLVKRLHTFSSSQLRRRLTESVATDSERTSGLVKLALDDDASMRDQTLQTIVLLIVYF